MRTTPVDPWDNWKAEWESALAACHHLGGKALDLKMSAPASAAGVATVERKLEHSLPESFRRVLLGFSSKVEVRWFLIDLPQEVKEKRPASLGRVFSGNLSWDLDQLPKIQKDYLSWIDSLADLDDSGARFSASWRKRLAFLAVDNGDFLTIDPGGRVIYFDHERGLRQEATVLAPDFQDFVTRSTELGCLGAEIWQYRKFLADNQSGLDPQCSNARLWRKWFGIATRGS